MFSFDSEILQTILQIVGYSTPVGLITWFVTKRHLEKVQIKQAEKDVEITSADVMTRNLGIYQTMLDDVEKRFKEKLEERDLEIADCKLKIEQRDTEIASLELKIDSLNIRIDELIKEVKKYKNGFSQ